MGLFDTFRGPTYQNLSPEDAQAKLGTLRVIDVREVSEFNDALGHIAGAELVPLATVGAAAATWDKDAPVLMVCRSGGRSGRAAGLLAGMGFTAVYNLNGGMMGWNSAGLPVARS